MNHPSFFAVIEAVENGFIVRSQAPVPYSQPRPPVGEKFAAAMLDVAKKVHGIGEAWQGDEGDASVDEGPGPHKLEPRATYCATFEDARVAIEAAHKEHRKALELTRRGCLEQQHCGGHQAFAFPIG